MKITIEQIKAVVCREFGLTRHEFDGLSRTRRLARPRQVAMTLARAHTSHSLPKIGNEFGRDHTTVIHAIRRVRALEIESPKFADITAKIGATLTGTVPMLARAPLYEHHRAMAVYALESTIDHTRRSLA